VIARNSALPEVQGQPVDEGVDDSTMRRRTGVSSDWNVAWGRYSRGDPVWGRRAHW